VFGFSFWEVSILLVVALIVIGPERLPGVARKAGEWTYKVRKFVANAKAEMDSEFNMQDMKQLLNSQESEISKLRAMVEETRHDIDQTGNTMKSALDDAEQTMRRSADSEKARSADRAGASDGTDTATGEKASDEAPAAPDDSPAPLKAIDEQAPSAHQEELNRLASETGEQFHRPFAPSGDKPRDDGDASAAESQDTDRHDRPADR